MQEDIYYIGVKNPVTLRRTILEASKELLESLKDYEKFKEVRTEKEKQIAKLKSIVKDITKSIEKIKSDLPKSKIKVEEIMKKEEAKEEEKKSKKKKKSSKSTGKSKKKEEEEDVSEIEKLEADLSDIESKLKTLS